MGAKVTDSRTRVESLRPRRPPPCADLGPTDRDAELAPDSDEAAPPEGEDIEVVVKPDVWAMTMAERAALVVRFWHFFTVANIRLHRLTVVDEGGQIVGVAD